MPERSLALNDLHNQFNKFIVAIKITKKALPGERDRDDSLKARTGQLLKKAQIRLDNVFPWADLKGTGCQPSLYGTMQNDKLGRANINGEMGAG